MTTTERAPALGGDEAAEQRSAPNLDAGVVGDLVEALKLAVDLVDRDVIQARPSERAELIEALTQWNAALAKYATQGTGQCPTCKGVGSEFCSNGFHLATHQPAISTDRSGPFSQAKIPGDTTADTPANREGPGE